MNDFWRLIVEQRCGLCIMLTNLQESGKIKCVQYWPEAGEPKKFGAITVRLVKEKVHSDYIVRTLRAEWPAGGLENGSAGGLGKKELENGELGGSRATLCSSEETKCHEVQQYHYLMWKVCSKNILFSSKTTTQ